jgi:hypothetical protein
MGIGDESSEKNGKVRAEESVDAPMRGEFIASGGVD